MPPPNPTAVLHAQIQREIDAYRQRTVLRERSLRETRHGAVGTVRPQFEAKEQVGYGCKAIDKMLDELIVQTKTDEMAEALLVNDVMVSADREDQGEVDLLDEVTTLRALASDDTSLETSSVADYGSEPPPARKPSASLRAWP